MTGLLTALIVLACPIGMASMMFLPTLTRRFSRTPDGDTSATSDIGASSDANAAKPQDQASAR